MAPLNRPLDVLRIDVSSAQDDHVLEPASHEELAIPQEAQVAGPEELALADRQARVEGFLRLLGSSPVAGATLGPETQISPTRSRGTANCGRGIDDRRPGARRRPGRCRRAVLRSPAACRLGDFTAPEASASTESTTGSRPPVRPKQAGSPRPDRSRGGTPPDGIRPGRRLRRSGRASPVGSARRR